MKLVAMRKGGKGKGGKEGKGKKDGKERRERKERANKRMKTQIQESGFLKLKPKTQ